jgi:hypothetical protein
MKKWKTDANGKKLYIVNVEEKTENKVPDVVDSGEVQLEPVKLPELKTDESSD